MSRYGLITWSRVHQLERDIADQLAAHRSQIQFDAGHVGDDDTGRVVVVGAQGRRGQVSVFVLHETVEGDAADVFVAIDGRH